MEHYTLYQIQKSDDEHKINGWSAWECLTTLNLLHWMSKMDTSERMLRRYGRFELLFLGVYRIDQSQQHIYRYFVWIDNRGSMGIVFSHSEYAFRLFLAGDYDRPLLCVRFVFSHVVLCIQKQKEDIVAFTQSVVLVIALCFIWQYRIFLFSCFRHSICGSDGYNVDHWYSASDDQFFRQLNK